MVNIKKQLAFIIVMGLCVFSSHQLLAQKIEDILAAQPVETQARYTARHPKETIEFFQLKPGMRVAEVLPGQGWYSKILLEYLGEKGTLLAIDYDADMWQYFGGFATPEFIEKRKQWTTTWADDAKKWNVPSSAIIKTHTFAEDFSVEKNSLDAVLFIRALHNLARFTEQGPFLDKALNKTYQLLKPGGVVGIVQHAAAEDRDDQWANGSNGYLKKSFVKRIMLEAGFEFVAETDINANPKDNADVGDVVWRLMPSHRVREGASEKEVDALKSIGESNRMTLLFKKPNP